MRRLPWTERLDRTVNWFKAFGSFDDGENRYVGVYDEAGEPLTIESRRMILVARR
jgi:hypothetical protein